MHITFKLKGKYMSHLLDILLHILIIYLYYLFNFNTYDKLFNIILVLYNNTIIIPYNPQLKSISSILRYI